MGFFHGNRVGGASGSNLLFFFLLLVILFNQCDDFDL
ncbi:hypothetical protein SDC9_69814 [bioreactor metagenome]|jgi:hypothetical protein|uniref:Uncharacterized protein n=1 Tax=bioreactor metagenome TaxID=1076179 RepID=A0A644Y9U4_9ZZZZ